MSWIIYAAIAPLVWSIYNVIDQFMVRKFFKDAAMIFILLSGCVAFFVGCGLLLFRGPEVFISLQNVWILLILGVFSLFIFLPYLKALEEDEASIAVPFFQTIPVFVFLMGWLILDEVPSLISIGCAGLIICASLGLAFDTQEIKFRWKTCFYMLLSSMALAANTIALRYFVQDIDWVAVVGWQMVGLGIAALTATFLFKRNRRTIFNFVKNSPRSLLPIFCGLEVVEIIARMSFVKALTLAPSAGIVQTFNGLQPFFVLIFGALAYKLSPNWFAKTEFNHHLGWRIICSSIIFIGIYFLYTTMEIT